MNKVAPFLMLLCMCLTACKSADSSKSSRKVFVDPGNRVITVERWASVAGFAIAWAVYPDKVVVFTRNDFEKPEHVIAEQTIDVTALANIKQEIKNLPARLVGKHFSKAGVHDGVFIRVSFSSSGALTSERIEVENMYLPDLAPLLEAVDAHLPADEQIHYEKSIGLRFRERTTEVTNVYVP